MAGSAALYDPRAQVRVYRFQDARRPAHRRGDAPLPEARSPGFWPAGTCPEGWRMRLFRDYRDLPDTARGGVVALGNFDGVHRGHQAVIAGAQALAEELRAPLGVMAFEPHPREFFDPDIAPFRLTELDTKARLLDQLGVDALFALTFDKDMARMSAPDFIMDVLVKGLGVHHVVVGHDFHFGKGRSGNPVVLGYMGEMEGFGVTVVEEVRAESDVAPRHRLKGQAFSSTSARQCLAEGDPGGAAQILGRWWTVEGKVHTGDQRGRTIGFATANVPLGRLVRPKLGVYAVQVTVEDGAHAGVYDGVANLGRRPTFDKTDELLEAHLFDFSGDIYGCRVRVALVDFIRAERKFAGLDELKAQIAKDSQTARARLMDLHARR